MRAKSRWKWSLVLPVALLAIAARHQQTQPPDLVGQWTLTNFDQTNRGGNRTLDFHAAHRVTIMNIYAKFFRDGTYTFTDAQHVRLDFKPGPRYPAETYHGLVQKDGLSFTLKNGSVQEYQRLDPDGSNVPPMTIIHKSSTTHL